MTDGELSSILQSLRTSHDWAPPCSELELVAFEERHRIELPRDYRRFLAEVGNGAIGDARDTVFPLGRTTYPIDGPFNDAEVGDLSVAFPLEITPGYWNRNEDRNAPVEHPSADDDNSDDDVPDDDDEYWEALEEKWQEDLWPSPGVFPFSYQGCTNYQYLVTAGPERGNVWEFEGGSLSEDWGPFCPTPNPLLRSISFIEWLCIHLGRADLLPK